jgi:hypothetical protein
MSDDLTKRVDQLETQVRRLLHLADMQRDPFIYFLVDMDATPRQEKKIHELLNVTEKRATEGEEISPTAFETRVGEIMGDSDGGHAIADSIVRACEETGRYAIAVRALKARGWLG